jgi:Asp-tRNA(Asn)/Glu-tRNA(Gln) amidotransferase A subunit family amidase
MRADDVAAMALPALTEAFRRGQYSPLEHAREVLAALEQDDHNAVVALDGERALRVAEERTRELSAGQWRGPLHGVAVGVKDMIDVAGLPTRCGSGVLADAVPADADAPVVARLRAAGAVIVAKTHTHEFGYGPTGDVSVQGPARNPHDPSRITGGSSSGSAAVVAAGHLPLALGSDTGCSVRTPAALCGVVGLKPTHGALPNIGVFPMAESLDHVGILATDVATTTIAWDALRSAGSADADLQAPPTRTLVLGRPVDDYWRPHDDVITDGVDAAAEALIAAGGVRVVDVHTPGIGELAAPLPPPLDADLHATHAAWMTSRPQDYQPATADRLRKAAQVSAIDYITAHRTRRRLITALREQLSDVDALLLPTTALRATPIDHTRVDGIAVSAALLVMTLPFNLTGWPAVSVPAPLPPGELPAGVQLVGLNLREHALLRLAAVIESATASKTTRLRTQT